MAKHRQTATGRNDEVSKSKEKDSEVVKETFPVREIATVRRAGAPVNSSGVSSTTSSALPSRAPSPNKGRKIQPFRFFDLPSELRLRVYEILLITPKPVDLDALNYRLVLPHLNPFYASRRMHEEAYRVFYAQTLRLFPHHSHGRFFYHKKPLLARLSSRYRKVVTCVELILGPGWTAPPRGQVITPTLGLSDCTNLRTLKVFVELDPSDGMFAGFRGKGNEEDTYQQFCMVLLRDFIAAVPSLETVEVDAFPGVRKNAPLVVGIVRRAKAAGKRVRWGPSRAWEKEIDEGMLGLEVAVAGMKIEAPRVVEVQA